MCDPKNCWRELTEASNNLLKWITSKRVGVILRVQGAKDSRIQVKYVEPFSPTINYIG